LSKPANITGSHAPQQDIAAADSVRALIKECIAWNRQSQRLFYETYAPALYQVVKRYVFNDAAAQEILNDAFYKIFTRLQQYAWQGPIEAWMRRIAVNTITDYLRKHIKDEHADIAEVAEEDAYVDNDAVSNLSYAELIGCTERLTHIQRTVFNLYVLESLSHKEIGAMLSISAGNSRWILNDARKGLKQIITSMK
jgi:RNA polymerase sigma factor (sigma-70 family)